MTDNSPPEDPFAVTLDVAGLKRRSVHGSFATVLSQAAKLVIQLGSQIVLARLLFPAEYGLIAMAYPVITFLQVFNDIGLGQAVVQRPTLIQEQVSALFWVNIAISGLLALAVVLLAPLAAWVYGEPRLLLLLLILGLFLPVTAISIVPNALLARQMRFGVMARNEVIAMLAGALVTILCAFAGLSYWSLLIGQFTNAVGAIILVWSVTSWRPGPPRFARSVLGDVKFGANITLSNLATFVTTSGDNIIVGLTTGKVSLGLYDRSYNLVARPIAQMMAPLSRIALPLLSRLAGAPDQYRAAYLQMIRTATLLIVPVMLVCITHGTALIRLFLGPHWDLAAPIFSWICVGGLTAAIYSSASWLLISQGRVRELRMVTALAAIINVASFLLGAIWGIVGIAMAGALGFVFVTTPLILFAATRSGPVRPFDLMRCLAPFLFAGLIAYLALEFGLKRTEFGGLGQIIIATMVSYGLFVGISLISEGNRNLLRGGLSSLKGLLPA